MHALDSSSFDVLKGCILCIFLFGINIFLFGMNIFRHMTLEIALAIPAKMTTNTTL